MPTKTEFARNGTVARGGHLGESAGVRGHAQQMPLPFPVHLQVLKLECAFMGMSA